MKATLHLTFKRIFLISISFLVFISFGTAQNVGINTTGANPDQSAMLDIVSTSKGLLIPRVSLSATNVAAPITSPVTSLLVYNTVSAGAGTTAVSPGYYFWNGSAWVKFIDSGAPADDWKLIGNGGTVAGTNFIGTTDGVDFVVKTTNTERMRVLAGGNVGVAVVAPTARLEVDYNSSNDFAAVKATGNYGPTNGYLGVQGKTDFDGVTSADWNGQEIGVAGISTGSSTTDNFGVLGHSNGAGVRGEHSTSGNWAELGTDTRSIDANGDAYINNGWLSVGGNTGTIRRYGVQEITWNGTAQAADNTIYQTLGTFVIPNNIPVGTTIRVDKILWNVDAYHEDANEMHQIHVRFSTMGSAWYGWNGNSADGASDKDWQYINNFGTGGPTFTVNQTLQMRVIDEGCCWSDYFRVFNMRVKVYYSYSTPLQDGDITADGRIYANSNQDVGDLAEYFEVQEEANYGDIIVLSKGMNNEYELSKGPYAQNIVGVVSENPSLVLNNPKTGPPVALAGRVKVKVVRSNTLIKSGDFLTTSDEPGKAMIATKPGATIGFAVENQEDGQEYVEILVQPGRFYFPNSDASYNMDSISNPNNNSGNQNKKKPSREMYEGE